MIGRVLCLPFHVLRGVLRFAVLAAVVACSVVVFGSVALSDWLGVPRKS